MKILYLKDSETLRYAAEELAKYYEMMTDRKPSAVSFANAPEKDAVTLGLLADLGRPDGDVTDPVLEDVLDISIENGKGFIAGSNDRSVLMGVYRFLRSAGCRFIRPGTDGELIPKADLDACSFTYRKKADHIFRGECSEGAISYEHLRDTVYWMPKVGLNMFMIEGLVPYFYMHKWYAHVSNLRLGGKGQVTDYAFLEGEIAKLEKDMVKLGLQFHNIGHGWMFEPLGVHMGSPAAEAAALKEEDKRYLAEVKGVRDRFGGDTFYTNFCYGNPEARKILVSFWVDYLKKKPYVDFPHVWLADALNNHCECPLCREKEPSDWYVILLNEIDEALTKEGIDSRLVFILYTDTLRPPVTERLKHPERFILLSARAINYNTGYKKETYEGEIPPYERNKFPQLPPALTDLWREQWKEKFGVTIPTCVYEYRFYTFHYNDLGHMKLAKDMHRDVLRMKMMGFDGDMSDQTPRAFFPTALPMSVMAETLFDTEMDYDAFAEDHLYATYGEDVAAAKSYLEKITEIIDPVTMNNDYKAAGLEEVGIGSESDGKGKPWQGNAAYAEALAQIPAVIAEILPVIEKNEKSGPAVQRRSWFYLRHHTFIVENVAKIYHEGALGNIEKARALYLSFMDELSGREMEIHEAFDLFLFDRYHRNKLGIPRLPYFG